MPERIFIPVKCLQVTNEVIELPCLESQEVRIGTVWKNIYRVIMLFNLCILPVGSTIKSSILTLNIANQAKPKKAKVFALHKITQKWSPIWNIFCPEIDPVPAAVVTVDQWTKQVNVDISGLVEDWMKDPQRNFGMLMKSVDENISNTEIRIYGTKTRNTNLWPSLNVYFSDIEVTVEPTFVKHTENSLIALNNFQFSAARKMGKAHFSSFFVRNTGPNSLIVQLEVSADGIHYTADGKEIEIPSGDQEILIPQYFGEFARVAYRCSDDGQITTLDIIYVAKLI